MVSAQSKLFDGQTASPTRRCVTFAATDCMLTYSTSQGLLVRSFPPPFTRTFNSGNRGVDTKTPRLDMSWRRPGLRWVAAVKKDLDSLDEQVELAWALGPDRLNREPWINWSASRSMLYGPTSEQLGDNDNQAYSKNFLHHREMASNTFGS